MMPYTSGMGYVVGKWGLGAMAGMEDIIGIDDSVTSTKADKGDDWTGKSKMTALEVIEEMVWQAYRYGDHKLVKKLCVAYKEAAELEALTAQANFGVTCDADGEPNVKLQLKVTQGEPQVLDFSFGTKMLDLFMQAVAPV